MRLPGQLGVLLGLTLLAVSPQAQRTIPAADSVLAYRSLNNLRVWTFTFKAKDVGRLVSFIDGTESVNGRRAIRINREFTIDYALLRQERTAGAVGQGFVSTVGYFLGEALAVSTDSVTERLELEVDNDRVTGYFTRQGKEIDQEVAWPRDYFAWDANMLDQLELFLAMRPIGEGSEFADSLFQPQSLLFTPLAGYCSEFEWVELYRGKFDSVFAIHLTAPTPMNLYFTAERELVRADFLAQGIRAYLDVNSQAKPNAAATPPVVGSRLSLNRVLQYFVFVVIGLGGVLFFNRAFYRYLESYVALVAGAAAFFLTLVTQVPLQELALGMTESAETLRFTTFLPPAAIAAVVQEVLKIAAIVVVLRMLRPQPGRSLVVGALVGGVFGVVEACWSIGFAASSPDFWTVLRNGAMILYHVSAGVLIGSALGGIGWRWPTVLGGVMVVHFVLRCLPALSFTGSIDDPLVALMVAALVLVLVGLTLQFVARRQRKRA